MSMRSKDITDIFNRIYKVLDEVECNHIIRQRIAEVQEEINEQNENESEQALEQIEEMMEQMAAHIESCDVCHPNVPCPDNEKLQKKFAALSLRVGLHALRE